MRPFQYYVLSHEPPILCFLGVGTAVARPGIMPRLPDDLRPVVLLEYPLSLQRELGLMEKIGRAQEELESQGVEHHFMVNTAEEDKRRIECGVRGANFSQNAFVNEHVFSPAAAEKKYDAVHIAGMYDVKRHELARRIKRLYVVTYNGKDLHAFRPELSHADYNRRYLSHPEVAALINQSRAGLCLSAVEGAMFASMEYLMCGVPVVTTPSKGGRDVFFDETNSICVEPDADAVLEGVETWKRNLPDAGMVRATVLRQITHVRNEFCRYVARIISDRSGRRVRPAVLMRRYYSSEGISARAVPVNLLTSPRHVAAFRYDDDSVVPQRIHGYREQLDGEALHLESRDGNKMTTDSRGAVVWGLCDGTSSVSDIAQLIADAYAREVDDVRAHVNTVLRHLEYNGLVA